MSALSELRKISERMKKMKSDYQDDLIYMRWSSTDPYKIRDPETGEIREVATEEEYRALGGKSIDLADIFNGGE